MYGTQTQLGEVTVPPLWWSALGPFGAGYIAYTGLKNLDEVTDVSPEVNQAIRENEGNVNNIKLGAIIVIGLVGFLTLKAFKN